MTWNYAIGKKPIVDEEGNVLEYQLGIVEHYPQLNAYSDFQQVLSLAESNEYEEQQEALRDLLWQLEKMVDVVKVTMTTPKLIIKMKEK